MDNSAIPLTAANEDSLDRFNLKSTEEIAKVLDHSPGRSSVKSVKETVAAKTNSKSIPKFPKSNVNKPIKNQTSLVKNENRLQTSMKPSTKPIIPVTNKSPNTLKAQGMSKIPFMKKSPSSSSNTNNKSTKQQVAQKLSPGKSPQLKLTSEKKSLEIKLHHLMSSNSKTSQSRSSSPQLEKIASTISKSSFVTSSPVVQQKRGIVKCQTARSNSVTPVSGANKRSVSNISTRSTPCSKGKENHESNLRKMISTAGDHNKLASVQNETKPQQENLPPEADDLKEDSTENVKVSLSQNDIQHKLKMYMDQWFSPLKEELKITDNNNLKDLGKFKEKLDEMQTLQSNGILSFIDEVYASSKEDRDMEMVKLKQNLEESNQSLRNLKEKFDDLSKQYEEKCGKWENELKEMRKADLGEIKELQKKLKTQEEQTKSTLENVENLLAEKTCIQEELNTYRESLATTNAKLQNTEQQLNILKKDLKAKSEIIKKFESDLEDKKKLEINLMEMTNKLVELETKVKRKSHNECVEHLKQISELTNKINCLERDKESKIQEKEKFEKEINDLREVNDKLQQNELKLLELQKEYEAKVQASQIVPDYSKEVQLEFAKFRQSEMEKRREIEKLKVELSKAQFNMCQLEQQIQRDQQLLEVRSELINSLQTNEKTHRIHMEELFAQVGEKNTTINELNRELQAKSEEFRNLFTTLSAKQMEVANQEHIIKLLEESNERSQMLRVKQEEKIGRMEEELTHLKQTIFT